jgi:membrane associated rhomboid family serine protease
MPSLADSVGKELKTILFFVGILWAVYLLSCLVPIVADYGLQPRRAVGLIGIVSMPFLHANLRHIVSNTIPLAVLLFLLAGSRTRSWRIVAEIIVLGGVLLWLFGRSANHVGASGLISGLITFLIIGGILERRVVPAAVAVITFLIYGGSLFWGLIPRESSVSWDGHWSGALAGVFLAFQVPRRQKSTSATARRGS